MGLVKSIVVKFLKARWGSILPAVFKAAAEGQFGEPVKKAYWFGAQYKTVTGVVLVGLAYGLEAVCNNYPAMAWGCQWSVYVRSVGELLALVGLVDGGTRAPWPEGAQAEHKEK